MRNINDMDQEELAEEARAQLHRMFCPMDDEVEEPSEDDWNLTREINDIADLLYHFQAKMYTEDCGTSTKQRCKNVFTLQHAYLGLCGVLKKYIVKLYADGVSDKVLNSLGFLEGVVEKKDGITHIKEEMGSTWDRVALRMRDKILQKRVAAMQGKKDREIAGTINDFLCDLDGVIKLIDEIKTKWIMHIGEMEFKDEHN